MCKRLLIVAGYLIMHLCIRGQCPGGEKLWNRIVYLRDSSGVPAGEQFVELKSYLLQMEHCPQRNDSAHMLLLLRIGWLVSLQGDFKSAIDFTNHAIAMIHAHAGKPDINEAHLIKSYHNLQILYDSTGQEKLKLKAMDSCISLAVRLKTGYPYAVQHLNWEVAYFFGRGDYYHCINYATLGEDIARKGRYHPEDIYYYISWKINSLIFLNRYDEAGQLAEKSIQECLQTGNQKNLGNLMGLKANIAEERGQVKEAISNARKSLYYDHKMGNLSDCAATWNNLGYKLYFLKLHENDNALRCYDEALHYANANDSVYILDNIANVYVSKGLFDKAFYFFRQAFDKIRPGSDEKDLMKNGWETIPNNGAVEYLVDLVLDKAEAYLKKYKLTRTPEDIQLALAIYQRADRLIDEIKTTQTEVSSKLFWRTDTRRLYEGAIECCFLSGNRDGAFYFFEKSRAVLLNDQLREQQFGAEDLLALAAEKKQILQLERTNIGLDPASKQYSDVQRALFFNKQELTRIEELIKVHNPWYYRSLLDTNLVSLADAQKSLLGNHGSQAILAFFNGDSALYVLTLLSHSCIVKKIDKHIFDTEVDHYMAYLSNPSLLNQDFPGFKTLSHQLYQLLFSQDSLPNGRIIISPDGRYFPFEALVTNDPAQTPVYLLNAHIVSYTYSVRYLLYDFPKNAGTSVGNFLGVAPVQYVSSLQQVSLPGSKESIEKIASNFAKAHILVADDASKNHFMQLLPSYKIIQLYTHASDRSANGEPLIYFADSALYLSELIAENKTGAQLIVLSACETGNGKLFKGEGVFSLNRGFAALGIPSSVTNLWSVDAESTYRLTELFYKYVTKGMPLDIALQKAKLDFIGSSPKEKTLPYYWAAAIVAGRTESIVTSGKSFWAPLIVMAALACFSLLLYLILRPANRKNTNGAKG